MKTDIETGLTVAGRTPFDAADIGTAVEGSDLYAEWDSVNRVWFFPEYPETYNVLERMIYNLFYINGITARIQRGA